MINTENMTVGKLKEILKHARDSDEVVIKIDEYFLGATPTAKVKSAYSGFDWDRGKFIISTHEHLFRKWF